MKTIANIFLGIILLFNLNIYASNPRQQDKAKSAGVLSKETTQAVANALAAIMQGKELPPNLPLEVKEEVDRRIEQAIKEFDEREEEIKQQEEERKKQYEKEGLNFLAGEAMRTLKAIVPGMTSLESLERLDTQLTNDLRDLQMNEVLRKSFLALSNDVKKRIKQLLEND